ncbi:hypothetical protein SB768_02505 [Burkholderia sp. SIMBA_043]|uniref:hypothetical protein n=2 Tax=Pseudomonadota TaxID=1224 RepID=UPI0005D9BFF0|nr:hypothetical protein [Burkholderia vietnamiensis]AJY05563.1 hypothetical protein AK36_1246 [Burkholderia vietnamiensis LMG 10929]AVR16499.1 hypothetical protein A8H33_24520 [Burkholderia vietnamiensis]KVM54340.1 hypothetical protein WJ57_13245 [Burkholderia vietnamiensis]KVS02476.1 hypothetical protein WK30_14805 [Burkholderia vietnamiensis]UBI25473.1 hypothetical protein LA325_19370 [Burkholderia vietnamiensis]
MSVNESPALGAIYFDRGVQLVAVFPKLLVEAPQGRAPVMVVKRKRDFYVVAGALILVTLDGGVRRTPCWFQFERIGFDGEGVRRFGSLDQVQAWIARTLVGRAERELFESIFM